MILAGLVGISLCGGLVMVWYTYRVESVILHVIEKNVAALQAAESLETAIVNQKGFVSYYYLDGNADWLARLDDYRRIFDARIDEARQSALDYQQAEAIDQIEILYRRYVALKDRVIAHYKAGDRDVGSELHQRVRQQFFTILALCEKYKEMHIKSVRTAQQLSSARASQLRSIAGMAISTTIILSVCLVLTLVKQVLSPITKLLQATAPGGAVEIPDNEVAALRRSVEGLIQNMDQSQFELAKSREHLQQVEKMAMVGKLAAGMAHSIRNPFTSVKMRLFSLNRTLNLTADQKDDFDVISAEIRHIDTIVQNFLEFSRPPKLVMQSVSPSSVVDNALSLLTHRLKSYEVKVKVIRSQHLPRVSADPEQLKEVLVNLFINACEALGKGGSVTVREDVVQDPDLGKMARIRISDDGPGIPAAVIGRVMEPFFTTKAEGTGLGLSIAARIIDEHGGRIDVTSVEFEETAFTIRLPIIGGAS